MRRAFPAAVLVFALALTACGSGGSFEAYEAPPIATRAAAAEPDATATSTADAPGRPSPSGATGSAKPAARAQDAPFGGPTPGPAAHNTMPLDVTLSATCARPGDTMRATATTLPSSKLAFTATYEEDDEGYVPDFQYVEDELNPTGTYTWTWAIKPTIDPGNALVTVVAAKDDKGASFNAPFRVARSC